MFELKKSPNISQLLEDQSEKPGWDSVGGAEVKWETKWWEQWDDADWKQWESKSRDWSDMEWDDWYNKQEHWNSDWHDKQEYWTDKKWTDQKWSGHDSWEGWQQWPEKEADANT